MAAVWELVKKMPSENPGERYWALIESVWMPLNEAWSRGVEGFLAASAKVPRKVLHLYAAHWCQSDVNNGGFRQFFSNTTGILAPEAAEGFRAIGLLEWAALVLEAMAFFETPYPRERAARLERLQHADGRGDAAERFAALDDKFYACHDASWERWETAADAYAAEA